MMGGRLFQAGLWVNLEIGQRYASEKRRTNILIKLNELANLWVKTGKIMVIPTRLFGTTNTKFVFNLQGNTQASKTARQMTKAVNPKNQAFRWLESKVQEVQCSTCGSVSKAKLKEQSVVISPHPPRKSRPVRNVTRWMEQESDWVLVQKKE
jgi:hypothetical protein